MHRFSACLLVGVTLTALACGGAKQPRQGGEEVAPSESVGLTPVSDQCPPDWRGPWTACPETDWVQQVAERAGYHVTGETGSALIAQGKGRSFYIWTSEQATGQDLNDGPTARKGPLGVVEGVAVYGDAHTWLWWAANGFVFWLQPGPYSTSQIPRLNEMESLVLASRALPPPVSPARSWREPERLREGGGGASVRPTWFESAAW